MHRVKEAEDGGGPAQYAAKAESCGQHPKTHERGSVGDGGSGEHAGAK